MKRAFIFILITLVFFSCRSRKEKSKSVELNNKFEILIEYIESNHDFINSPESPAARNSAEVYNMLNENIHIIDIRTPEEFAQGRVPGAVNVQLKNIIEYFENSINPSSFEKIFLFSKDHQESMFANGVLRMLGYDNTFNIRWGMASWNSEFVDDSWGKAVSDHLEEFITTKSYSKNKPGEYPVVKSAYDNGYDILRERAIKFLNKDYKEFLISAQDVVDNPDKYYLINYWPKDYYDKVHLINAINYEQRTSLKRDTYLSTLPTSKTIVLYCYSNSTTPIAAAYLHILGYDVKTIEYGTNGFMYNKLIDKIGSSYFSDKVVNDFPVETDDGTTGELETEEIIFAVPEGEY